MTVKEFAEIIDENSFVYVHHDNHTDRFNKDEKISEEIADLEITKIYAESMYIFGVDAERGRSKVCLNQC